MNAPDTTVEHPAEPRMDPKQDRVGVRVLVVGWCVWLLGAWVTALSLDSAVPAGRWMIFSTLIGMLVIWPAYRLSVPRHWADVAGGPMIAPLLDWFSLYFIVQAVIWPLMITAQWTVRQTLWLDLAIGAWSLVSALLIAWGCRSDHGGLRMVAMALCLLLIVGEPLLLALAGAGDGRPQQAWTMRVSPVETVWALSSPTGGFDLDPWRWHVCSVLAAAAVGWAILAGFTLARRHRRTDLPVSQRPLL